jgi:hypothetical protein
MNHPRPQNPIKSIQGQGIGHASCKPRRSQRTGKAQLADT